MAWVQSARWLDSGVMALFLMIISAACLHMFSHFWNILQKANLAQYRVGPMLKVIFHLNKSFEFNLTHVLLMSIVIALLSLRPDYELEASLKKNVGKKEAKKVTETKKTTTEH